MKKLNFSARIKATREKVWKVLWNDETYRVWTSVFHEGSHAVSDWKDGSKVLFLSPDGSGMYSTIAKSIPNEFMSFRHLGELKNGKEEPASDWSGAMENYTLKDAGGETELSVELDATGEFADYFKEIFPRALEKIKSLSES